MPVFKDVSVVKDIFGDLWSTMIKKTDFGPKMKESNISVLYIVSNPDVAMYVDGDTVKWDEEAKNMNATITMTMSADTVHKFWLKKLNLPKALATRQIKTKGPVPKILKLLPFLKPGYPLYKEYCKKYNLPTE